MVRLPGIRHPSSVVYSQVDFCPHHDVGQERSSYPCQYPQVEQLVGNSKQQNIGDKDGSPESECHCDVLGIGRRRTMESVTHGSRLVQARPVHRPAMVMSASAWSTLDSSQTAIHNAEAGVQAAEQNLESAKATLLEAQANAEKSDADPVRYSQLVAKEDISRQQYDQASAAAKADRAAVVSDTAAVQSSEQTLHQAEGKLLQAKADLRSAQTAPQQVSVVRAKADAAKAQVDQRKAQLDQTELSLSYTVIRSPVNGIVGRKTAEVGQNVSVGQELVDVVPLDDVWVTANFKETQLEHMKAGQPVEIKVDAYGRSWKGHVTNLGGGTGSVFSLLPPENATGNYVKVVQRVPVRIDFDRSPTQDFNSEGLLKPGLSAEPDVRVR